MIIYLVGIGCVGKTTVGKRLAEKIGFPFYDLDEEVERYYQKPIERIQNECFSINAFREKASVVLDSIFNQDENSVVAGTQTGLKYSYLQIYKKHKKKKGII
jgi:shikimate kinase